MRCPDESVLAAFLDDGLRPPQRASVQSHLDSCVSCRTLVSDHAHLARPVAVAEGSLDGTLERTLDVEHRPGTAERTLDVEQTLDVDDPVFDSKLKGANERPTEQTLAAHRRVKPGITVVPGTMIGEYEVTGTIGAGGMGAVFAAIHPRIGKRAAIKVLQRDLAGDPRALTRFENEARAVNAIGHENLVDIFAFGELPDGNPYFVMAHVEGDNLETWIRKRGRVSLAGAMPILRQIFAACAAAHDRGIIHRDLKPGNVMIAGTDAAPRVKVLDFGLAKMVHEQYSDELTNPGIALGTPHFMSPEQHLGGAVDHRTDIYALGVLVYQMLCGRYPFNGTTPEEMSMLHLNAEPTPPSSIVPELPPGVDVVMRTALAKDPAMRYASVRELLATLESCLASAQVASASTATAITLRDAPDPSDPGRAQALAMTPTESIVEARAAGSSTPLLILAGALLCAAVVGLVLLVL